MALYRKPKTIREWILNNQPVTWFAHGLITILYGNLAYYLSGSLLAKAGGATLIALLFFLPKEQKDEKDHKEEGDWNKRDYMGITPMLDKYGDLGVPCIVAFSDWVTYLVSII